MNDSPARPPVHTAHRAKATDATDAADAADATFTELIAGAPAHYNQCTTRRFQMSMSRVDVPQEAPRITSWNTVVSYASYAEAQAAVDRLTADSFPVEELEIVGSGLRTVERVTGPMSWNRAVLSGAAGGAWIGIFIGILIGLFSSGGIWPGLIFGGLCIGAAWGAMFAVSARWYTRGVITTSPRCTPSWRPDTTSSRSTTWLIGRALRSGCSEPLGARRNKRRDAGLSAVQRHSPPTLGAASPGPFTCPNCPMMPPTKGAR